MVTYLGKTSDGFTIHDAGRRISDPRNTFFVHYYRNPVISGLNLYAPSPVKANGTWKVYFGGWQTQADYPYDAIYMSTTSDDTLTSGFSPTQKIIGQGIYQHVNDPSVVWQNGRWVMALTTKPHNTVDKCSVLTSADGVNWPQLSDRSREVSFSGANVTECARPSLIWNAGYNNGAGRWELYFDGKVNGGAHQQHLAVSGESTPKNFTYVGPVGAFADADIKLVNGLYIAAYRSLSPPQVWPILYATSSNGINFTEHGELLGTDPLTSYDDCGVTNPGWAINEQGIITALMFGGTSSCSYDRHQLGVALPQVAAILYSGNVGHVHRQAIITNVQRIETHQYSTVNRIQVFEKPGAAPILDETIPGTRGDAWSIKSITFTLLPRQNAIASSVAFDSMNATKAIDNNASTFYSSSGGPANRTEWLTVDLGSPQPVSRVILKPRSSGYGFPINFTIQTSNNGINFFDVSFQQYTGFLNPGSNDVLLAFLVPITTRYVRLIATNLGTDNYGNPYLQMAEFFQFNRQTGDNGSSNPCA